jgi:hypothetical protein
MILGRRFCRSIAGAWKKKPRIRRDDELGLMVNQPVQGSEHAQLALWRERGFRLVEQLNAVPLETMLEQRQKRRHRGRRRFVCAKPRMILLKARR